MCYLSPWNVWFKRHFQSIQQKFGCLPINNIIKIFEKTSSFINNQCQHIYWSVINYPFLSVMFTIVINQLQQTLCILLHQLLVLDANLYTSLLALKKWLLISMVLRQKFFLNILQDIIWHRGAPTKWLSDHSNLEISSKMKDIFHYLIISNCQNEPYHKRQNFAESQYYTIKESTNRIMDQTGIPAFLWLEALKYTCFLLNHTICQSLDNIPMQLLAGSTYDISALIQFH